jgi:hypothetical protein
MFAIPPGARTYPGISMYTTSCHVESQNAIVHHHRDFPPFSIEQHRTKPLPPMPEMLSNTQFATYLSPARTIELGSPPRRYQNHRIWVELITAVISNEETKLSKLEITNMEGRENYAVMNVGKADGRHLSKLEV